jgi:sialidase-1
MLQGPGKGITMEDGTLVFPAQFKDEKEMPHSTIIYSKDQGKTWKIGTGAKPNTTEAQVVELEEGVLMMNMRDNRGGSRSIYTSTDMGMTWGEHSSSRSALIEPVCMASLIKHNYKGQELILFSNPNSTVARQNMTIKLSKDMGDSWPEENQLLLDEGRGRGYSCMTSIDEETIGILYEGSQADLIFQKIKIKDLLK